MHRWLEKSLELELNLDQRLKSAASLFGQLEDVTFKGQNARDRSVSFLDVFLDTEALESKPALSLISKVLGELGNPLPDVWALALRRNFPDLVSLVLPRSSNTRFSLILPFSWIDADAAFLAYNFRWIESHIKLEIEKNIGRSIENATPLVTGAYRILSIILRCEDHAIFSMLNNTLAVYLQQLSVQLVVGQRRYNFAEPRNVSRNANEIAFAVIEKYGRTENLETLCGLSAAAGTLWFSSLEIQAKYAANPKSTIQDLGDNLEKNFHQITGVENISKFIDSARNLGARKYLFILDDNGESIFDLLLLQRLLEENPRLSATLLIGTRPVKNNFSRTDLDLALKHSLLESMNYYIAQGRVSVLEHEQMLMSLDLRFVSSSLCQAIESHDCAYIKGVSFFETVQISSLDRYHSFMVHGTTSELLTSESSGVGLFLFCPKGQYSFDVNIGAALGDLQ